MMAFALNHEKHPTMPSRRSRRVSGEDDDFARLPLDDMKDVLAATVLTGCALRARAIW